MSSNLKKWINSGEPYIWLNAGAVSLSIIMVAGLIALIAVRGLGHFWPSSVIQFQYQEGEESTTMIGEMVDEEIVVKKVFQDTSDPTSIIEEINEKRILIKTGNRDFLGLDFRWVLNDGMKGIAQPNNIMVVERREWGNFYGILTGLKANNEDIDLAGSEPWIVFQNKIRETGDVFKKIRHIEKNLIGAINYKMEKIRLRERGLELKDKLTEAAITELNEERETLQKEYEEYANELAELYSDLNQTSFTAQLANGDVTEIPLSKVVRAYRPNEMTVFDKTVFYFEKLWEFMTDEPREANTEGGIFPAIFGTVMMVMIMAVLVTPFGVVAAVYLREYAKQGPVTRLIRIAVNNLAGVPSVVYGVFGLGFFVYFLGGSIDQLFFPEALPAPTFGTPGLMWASLTLAILTVPVVIVATEEGLSRVPRSIREGSLALGATKAETLWLTVLPMTASAMMTGLILAVARAAGEVAPLMLVGVVKLAPSLPLDGNAPYLHLDRKFMHLGFHIYDVGFQSPNVEAARPLVYATALLLVLIIIALNLTAIKIRNNLREKYRAAEQH